MLLLRLGRRTRQAPELCIGLGMIGLIVSIPLMTYAGIGRLDVADVRMGAAALDMAWVACGRFDGYWEHGGQAGVKPWDAAAGILLVTEAGGTVSHVFGSTAMGLFGVPQAREDDEDATEAGCRCALDASCGRVDARDGAPDPSGPSAAGAPSRGRPRRPASA